MLNRSAKAATGQDGKKSLFFLEMRLRAEREFPFPAIPGNTGLPFPFPKIGNDFFIPVPVTGNGLSKSGIRTGIEFKRCKKEGV